MSGILLINISCGYGKQPYTPSVPVSQIPRIEAPSTVKDKLAGGSKQYIIYARAQQDLGVRLDPGDGSVRFTILNMQTSKTLGPPDKGSIASTSIVPSTGDYLITVFGEPKAFTLTCTIR
jgi:hypothetical protein